MFLLAILSLRIGGINILEVVICIRLFDLLLFPFNDLSFAAMIC